MKTIREKWDEIVRMHFDGDYERADSAFSPDEEARHEQINNMIPDSDKAWTLAGHEWFCSRVGKSDPAGETCVCHTLQGAGTNHQARGTGTAGVAVPLARGWCGVLGGAEEGYSMKTTPKVSKLPTISGQTQMYRVAYPDGRVAIVPERMLAIVLEDYKKGEKKL